MSRQSEFEQIKKDYGEAFAKYCRAHFSTIMEDEGKLIALLHSKFIPSHFLFEDIKENALEGMFKNFIIGSYMEEENKIEFTRADAEEIPTPEQLMEKAGYVLTKCETNQDVLAFRKYYQPRESLCTFTDPARIRDYHIFFAVKKDVDAIKRENFKKPLRQDEYGTSVICLQFSKGKESSLSIKNRYNHSVQNCDATFSNDLENIIAGLTESFEKHYGLHMINGRDSFEIPNYVQANDGRFYRFNYEINNVYYCAENVVIINGYPVQFDKSKYEVVDYFIFDKKEHRIMPFPINTVCRDSFTSTKLQDLVFTKKGKRQRVVELTTVSGEKINLTINEKNQIISYENNSSGSLPDDYMTYASYLKNLSAPNIKKMGRYCFSDAKQLENLDLENLEEMDAGCFCDVTNLRKVTLSGLKKMDEHCFAFVPNLFSLSLPQVQKIGSYCFETATSLTDIDMRQVKKIEDHCFSLVDVLGVVNLPELESVGDKFLEFSPKLKRLVADKMKYMGDSCCVYCDSLNFLRLNGLKEMGSFNFMSIASLDSLNMPSLEDMGQSCFTSARSMEFVYLNSLYEMGKKCFSNTPRLNDLRMQSLKKMGAKCFLCPSRLEYLSLPQLQEIGVDCFNKCESLTELYLPSLSKLESECFNQTNNLQEVELSSLKEFCGKNFEYARTLKSVECPKGAYIGEDCFTHTEKSFRPKKHNFPFEIMR